MAITDTSAEATAVGIDCVEFRSDLSNVVVGYRPETETFYVLKHGKLVHQETKLYKSYGPVINRAEALIREYEGC